MTVTSREKMKRDQKKALRQTLETKKEPLRQIYGAYADKIWLLAVTGPSNLKAITDGKRRGSLNTINYFIENYDKINIDALAEVLGISREELLAESPKLNANVPDEHVQTHDVAEQEQPTAMPEKTQKRNERRSDMVTSNQPVSDKDGLLEACYDVFGERRSTGQVLNAHLDPKGYPTIGCGHLIYRPGKNVEAQRRRHIKAMKAIGIDEKTAGAQFDALVRGPIQHKKINGVDVITSPKISITHDQAKALFKYDAEKSYQNALKNFPDLHKYPIEVQVAIVHHAYHYGNTDGLKKKCKGDLSAENVVRQMINMRTSGSKNEFSSNSAYELKAACDAVGIEPPAAIKNKTQKNGKMKKVYDNVHQKDQSGAYRSSSQPSRQRRQGRGR